MIATEGNCALKPVKKISLDKEKFFYVMGLIWGSIFSAVAINGFLAPNKMLSGGTSGMAILLNAITQVDIGIWVFGLNIPLFILSFMKLDKKFTISSFINMFIFSAVLILTSSINQYITISDPVLVAVFGGALNGLGMGVTFRIGASQGGTDIIAMYLKKKFNIPLSTTLMSINVVIVSLGGFLFGAKPAMYTLISMYVAYQVVDKVQVMMDKKKSVMIISNKYDEISKDIMNKQIIGRGVTLLSAKGAYSNSDQMVIYSIVTSSQMPKLKEIVLKYDPKAFISVNDISEIKGKGFRETL